MALFAFPIDNLKDEDESIFQGIGLLKWVQSSAKVLFRRIWQEPCP